MFRSQVTVLLCAGLALAQAGWQNGAPCMAQHTLRPNVLEHGTPVTITKPPYDVTFSDINGIHTKYYRPGQTYKLRLSGLVPFKNFLIQPRLATKEGHIIGHLRAGEFLPDKVNWELQGIKVQACAPIFNNSITNADDKDKYEVEVLWKTDRNLGPVQFFFTILQDSKVYWQRWQPNDVFLLPAKGDETHQGSQGLNQPPPDRFETQEPWEIESGSGETPEFTRLTGTGTIDLDGPVDVQVESGDIEIFGSGEGPTIDERIRPPHNPDFFATTVGPDGQPTSRVKTGDEFVVDYHQVEENLGDDQTTTPWWLGPTTTPWWLGPSTTTPWWLAPTTTTTTTERTTTTTTEDAPRVEKTILDARTGRLLTFSVKVKDYCKKEPCFNNATCTNLPEEDDFYCDCATSFTGKRCDQFNHCENHECKNGALCRNREDDYQCECRGEWAGKFCETDCPAYLCENGGKCTIDDEINDYKCECAPGWEGKKCDQEINECRDGPCKNGATCTDKFDNYQCTCKPGYMGNECHRPCQDVYQSCNRWQRENRCINMRQVTKFFDDNCAVTCGRCSFVNDTVRTLVPMPPILEPYAYLIGRWESNSTHHYRYPVDFEESTSGYVETLEFTVPPVPMFGTPSINVSIKAVSKDNPEIAQWTYGFMTLNGRHKKGRPYQIAFVHTGNDGITFIEEGILENKEMRLRIKYSTVFPSLKRDLPDIEKSVRTFTLAGPWLQETVKKINSDGSRSFFSKFFYRVTRFTSY